MKTKRWEEFSTREKKHRIATYRFMSPGGVSLLSCALYYAVIYLRHAPKEQGYEPIILEMEMLYEALFDMYDPAPGEQVTSNATWPSATQAS
jgi:hypothetical protein